MTAPLFLVAPGTLTEGTDRLRLDGPEGHHAADVQRLRVGEEVLVGDGEGRLARCTVAQVERGALDLRVDSIAHEPEPALRLVLVQALAKGDRDLMAVEAATELDVDEILPWQADRSIVRWRAERGEKARRKWEQQARAAGKQSRRSRLPLVGELVDRRGLLARASGADAVLVLHEDAGQPLTEVPLPPSGEVLLVVGPEGGIAPEELDALRAAGATPVRLGRTVLRTSTAGAAALAVLHTRTGWR